MGLKTPSPVANAVMPTPCRPAGKKGEGKTPRTHQVMGSNPWEVVTPKMGNPGGDFGLVGPRRGPDTEGSKQKKKRVYYYGFWGNEPPIAPD